jgi:hypothetical protein
MGNAKVVPHPPHRSPVTMRDRQVRRIVSRPQLTVQQGVDPDIGTPRPACGHCPRRRTRRCSLRGGRLHRLLSRPGLHNVAIEPPGVRMLSHRNVEQWHRPSTLLGTGPDRQGSPAAAAGTWTGPLRPIEITAAAGRRRLTATATCRRASHLRDPPSLRVAQLSLTGPELPSIPTLRVAHLGWLSRRSPRSRLWRVPFCTRSRHAMRLRPASGLR